MQIIQVVAFVIICHNEVVVTDALRCVVHFDRSAHIVRTGPHILF